MKSAIKSWADGCAILCVLFRSNPLHYHHYNIDKNRNSRTNFPTAPDSRNSITAQKRAIPPNCPFNPNRQLPRTVLHWSRRGQPEIPPPRIELKTAAEAGLLPASRAGGWNRAPAVVVPPPSFPEAASWWTRASSVPEVKRRRRSLSLGYGGKGVVCCGVWGDSGCSGLEEVRKKWF